MITIWKVRAEIPGEFVNTELFGTESEARAYADKLIVQGIYDSVEVFEIVK